jgi:putative peptidoglycan lipid II flippase
MSDSEFRQTTRNAGLIGLTAFGGAIVGFILQLLVAFHFGAGSTTDAYFMAQSTSEMLSKLLMGGSITAVFIPMFVQQLTKGKQQNAWEIALNIFHLMVAIYMVLIVLLAIFAAPFTRFIAPGFDPSTLALTVQLLRVLLPSFLFLFLVELATAMLHSLRVFSLPATLRIVAPLVSVIAIVLFVRQLGIFSLALGAVTGSLVQFGMLWQGLRHQGLSYRFIFRPTDATIRRLLWLVYPFIFSVLMTQGAGIVYRILVSDLTAGSLASLKFAEKITQLLTIMFLSSVTLVIYPLLSAKASKHDMVGIRQSISAAIRLIFFLTVPLVVGVALLRKPLVQILFERGSFSPEDTALTSIALLFLVIGLTTNGISSVFGHTVLALQETRAAVAVTVASQAIAIALFVMLVPLMAHAGLALASSLVPIAIAGLYFLYLQRYVPQLGLIFRHRTYVKTVVLAIALAIAISIIQPFFRIGILQLLVPTSIGSLIYFGGAYLWRIHEMHELSAMVKSKYLKLLGHSTP